MPRAQRPAFCQRAAGRAVAPSSSFRQELGSAVLRRPDPCDTAAYASNLAAVGHVRGDVWLQPQRQSFKRRTRFLDRLLQRFRPESAHRSRRLPLMVVADPELRGLEPGRYPGMSDPEHAPVGLTAVRGLFQVFDVAQVAAAGRANEVFPGCGEHEPAAEGSDVVGFRYRSASSGIQGAVQQCSKGGSDDAGRDGPEPPFRASPESRG